MADQPFRNPNGGAIDRGQPLCFTFNNRSYWGYRGDTLASALVANGVRLVGRSFKYHRPRGIFGIGAEEPNALVQLGQGARTEPNTRATQIELYDGLSAASQNCWPSVGFDLGAVSGRLSAFLPAGFYYKTFMWPPHRWMAYEWFIRRAAGMGRAPVEADPDRYEHFNAHCDVLVIGGGPAGLAAALAAGRAGARVILAEDAPAFGGMLRGEATTIDGSPADRWTEAVTTELRALPDVVLLRRTVAFGYYDHNQVGLVERPYADLAAPPPHAPRQRLWHVRARRVVLATGANERSMAFGNNDRPGVMLASAARAYVNRYAARPGKRAVVFTNNDSAYAAAATLSAGGVEVAAVVDVRPQVEPRLLETLRSRNIESIAGHAVLRAEGTRGVSSATVVALDGRSGPARRLDCDLLCVSGGWNPTVHLHAQARGRPAYDAGIASFVPGASFQVEQSVGAAKGTFALAACLAEGFAAGARAAAQCGHANPVGPTPLAEAEPPPAAIQATWRVGARHGRREKRFVDLQNDVLDADIELAVSEGYRSIEHVKRYTTLGMGTDQGKTSNAVGFALVAEALGADMAGLGTTTFRPPYVPVALGALAGSEGGHHVAPVRRTPLHDWHLGAGAVMAASGQWMRPQAYPRPGETLEQAARREAETVRRAVGIVDVSTLGKIEIHGRDAAAFLERVYTNRWTNLPAGRCRYGLMLREDGMVFDDGTTTRFGEHQYFMTTTTAQYTAVHRKLEYYRQVVWPGLDLWLVPAVDAWASIAVAGPRSRAVLAQMLPRADLSDAALPFMGAMVGEVGGVPYRLFRISFSGELAYELAVPADRGAAVWQALLDAGAPFGIAPYGVDALNILRIEKGHVTGAELNGRTTADDLGFARMLRRDGDFIGRRSLSRPGLTDPDRRQLVGLVPADGVTPLPRGAQIVTEPPRGEQGSSLGELTSACISPHLGKPIGLALVSGGRARLGQQLLAVSPVLGRQVAVTLTSPHFFDPEGARLRG
ncbi:MAG: sarcosine oxidase subunit alpha family protein [Alphaproteobacteria bacterium]|nr:sarcosine oxidase subunit alpha family protein [Alphaproteobacteria bacterium]